MELKTVPARVMTWFVLCSVVAVLYFAREFLVPIALAIFIAFVLAPLVRRLTRAGLPRVLATILTMAGVTIVLSAIGWMLVSQVHGFAEELPEYRWNLRSKIADVRSTLGSRVEKAAATVRELGEDLASSATESHARPAATDRSAEPPVASQTLVTSLPTTLGSMALYSAIAGLVYLLAAVMLLRWDDLRDRILALAGENEVHLTSRAARDASANITRYLRQQLLVNTMHGTAAGLLLWWIGVPNPLVWGLVAGLLRFIPYVGPVVGTLAPILVSFASSDGWTQTWITAGALVGLEVVTANLLEPWIYGACTGISPLAILVSAAFWTWIWGPVGLVLSTPLTVCLLAVGKHFPHLRFLDILFGDEPALSRPSRLYHRLLAGDQDEAWEILREGSAERSLVEIVDGTLVPALELAAIARTGNWIDSEARERIGVTASAMADELEDLVPTQSAQPAPGAPRVLCFPARDAFDGIAGRILVREMSRSGTDANWSGHERLLGEVLEVARRGELDVVVISAVVPIHFLHVRSLCKRLLANDSCVEILVGLWGEASTPRELAEKLPDSPRIHVVTSIAEALRWSAGAAARVAPRQDAPAVPA